MEVALKALSLGCVVLWGGKGGGRVSLRANGTKLPFHPRGPSSGIQQNNGNGEYATFNLLKY